MKGRHRGSGRKSYRRVRILVKRNKKYVIIGIGAVAIAVVFFLVIKPLVIDKTINMGDVSEAQTTTQAYEKTQTEDIDSETLAGLIGEDSALTVGEGEFSGQGIKIGVTMTDFNLADISTLKTLEKQAAQEITKDTINDFYVYDADGDENQQIQDVFSMINSGINTLIIVNTTDYNTVKIIDIALSNKVKCLALNSAVTEGLEANVIEKDDSPKDFATFIKNSGQAQTYVLRGNPKQIGEISGIIPVKENFEDIQTAGAAVENSIKEKTPITSMICLDNNPGNMLKVWVNKGEYPNAYAAYATVDYIKTWYELINGGTTGNPNENAEISTPAVEDEVAGNTERQNTKPISVEAKEGEFAGYAITKIENTGDVLFELALNIALGKSITTPGYVVEIQGSEVITQENLEQYYNKVKDMPSGFIYSKATVPQIAELFAN